MKTQLFLNMILKQFESDFNVIFKPPRPLKSCKMHGRGIKNQKKHFSQLDSKNDPSLLNRFKTHPKRYLNSKQTYDEKLKPKIPNLSSNMDGFFGVFGS